MSKQLSLLSMKNAYFRVTMLLLALLALLACVAPSVSRAQGQAQNRYFGDHAAVRFNTAGPVALPNGAMVSYEGCATLSDPNGQLLAYSNGEAVWDSQHQIMPNRWGRQVYDQARYDNRWNATGQAAGIYYYLLSNTSTGERYQGWVEVMRGS